MAKKNILFAVCAALILAAGIFLRVHPTAAFHQVGSDEATYTRYLGALRMVGIANYRAVVKAYEEYQATLSDAIVHPLRMNYLVISYGWMQLFHCNPLAALHAVASAASILHLLLAGVVAWRFGGRSAVLGVLALAAFAPLQICLAQRALVDGFYAFFAMLSFWLLWENLRTPNHWGWLAAFTGSLFMLVLTKEYSAFVVFAFCAIMALNHWLDFGWVTPKLLAATAAGPALAVLVLMYFAGGAGAFFHFYLEFVQKSRTLGYAINWQDGPWSRYLLDFLLVTPAVLLLAVGRMFQLDRKNPADLFCAVFLVFSYVPMACVTYGMSLRFASFWDLPMCWLAYSMLRSLAGRLFARRATVALAVATVIVCGIELREYSRVFVEIKEEHPVYDPITHNLLEADHILKYKPE